MNFSNNSRKTLVLSTFGTLLLAGSMAATAQIVVRIGPPPPRPVEVIPPRPAEHPDWEWHNGYHRWDGAHYVWVPGYYEHPPHPHAHWVQGHWDRRGDGYVWIEGHWR